MEGFERSSNEPAQGAKPPVRAGKFLAPASLPGQLERSTLLAQLEQYEGVRLILISACAGYGKTTLLQQYRERCINAGRRVLWCNLDQADNEPARLLHVLSIGLRELGLLEEYTPDEGEPARYEQWLLEHLAASSETFTLLLDDFQAIDNPQALDFFQRLLKALPVGSTLAIAARTTPDINLGRLRARGELLEIGTDALRLSIEETAGYILQKRQLPLDAVDIGNLHQRCEGWITGIYLATLSLQRHSDPAAFIASFNGSNPALAEYFAEDVLARQTAQRQQFLLQTSVLSRFCPALCDAVTGHSDSKAMIESLERDNLFVVATDDQRQWFRFHSLFADFLLQSLKQHSDKFEQQHRAAAYWFFTNDQPVDALEHLFAAHAVDEAAKQLVLHIDELVENGHASLLMRWLSRIPVEIRDLHPRLGIAYAWALLHARRHKDALQVLENPALADEHHYVYPLLLLIGDRVHEALLASTELLERLGPQDTLSYRLTAFVQACSLFYSGRFDEARNKLGSAGLREAQRESAYLRDVSDALEAMLDLTQGQLDSALTRVDAAMRRSRESFAGTPPVGFPILQTIHCVVLYETAALDEAQRRLSELLPYAREHAAPDSLISIHVLLARIAYLNADRPNWMRHLADLDQLGQVAGSTRILCSTWLERARVATLENRLDTADHAMRAAEQLSDWEQTGVTLSANDVDIPFIARQRLRIAQGDGDCAEPLRQAIDQALQRHQHRRALKLRLLLAMALDGTKQHKEALEQLTLALRFASHVGFIRTFLDEGAPLAAVLERWSVTFHGQEQALGIRAGFIALLLKGESSSQKVEGNSEDATTTNLSNRELQVVRMLALGYRNREIAEKMFLSELTVKSHLRKINTKLGAGGRTEAVSIARAQGLLD
ncbi:MULTISPECIES: LuxR C-terminal-related transcriptional regulator [unclassified Pseudomonas]|jgi:LuxR family maltose regulon positive regulatory protein|uniref:LuxR C-terminal-related transcriptional regulator n=1 Tax=unclassified Pseudomonas TaxID=196821 RepID=UPI00069F0AA8|nr:MULTISPECIES: LuxR C-terminal-related transcriptional regulator [unclassified Pseudomonas]WPN44802.1 LuxR C-terminal-related transcriptional regulator [Pseudomonas sp. P8_241]